MFKEQLKISLLSLLWLTILTGFLYPSAMTALSQLFFHRQANGSLIFRNGQPVGSKLIGQRFDDPKYFFSRLSATAPAPYNASGSSGSNLGPLNPSLIKEIKDRIDALRQADPGNNAPIPIDLVTSSASGLDPDISLAAAIYQLKRVSRVRGLPELMVGKLIEAHTTGRFLGILGEPRVNVLELNLALDELKMRTLN